MAILSLIDKATYFPDVTITDSALHGAIIRATTIAEGANGANRPLEQQSITQIVPVNRTLQTCYLSRFPIAVTPSPQIEARMGKTRDGFGRGVPLSRWLKLSPDDYFVDYETGGLSLYTSYSSVGWTEIKATYTAGFDFSLNTPDTRAIKSCVAAIMSHQLSNSYQGISSVKIPDEIEISYASGISATATIPESLLLPLQKYRPRSFC